jgi:predicted phage baseplate assembly protein
MAAPNPSLDDRSFQDIVDGAKRLIPQFCPEWTDHNVSDPGVALIELFAWMTEMLLYRVNQIPERIYLEFLNLIGLRLSPPQSALAPVTFYLTTPPSAPMTIPAGTEIATLRTEAEAATVFTLEGDATVRPPILISMLTRNASHKDEQQWTELDLRRLQLSGQGISIFPPQPSPGDALFVGFREDQSDHVLAILVDCSMAAGAGIDPTQPPRQWEVWQGGLTRTWAACEIERDSSGGFNQPGEIILRLPTMAQGRFYDRDAYWLRCRLIDPLKGTRGYKVSPVLKRLRVEARGITGRARHLIIVKNEVLGRSDGSPGQTFRLQYTPVLTSEGEHDPLFVEVPGEPPERWHEVDDFAASGPGDKHFTLDHVNGTIKFGPALLQPDGSIYRFGAVPPQGSVLHFERYRHGGGAIGNLSAGALSVVRSSIPYVARVTNWKTATGGRDAQTLEDAKVRLPEFLRTQNRAVTAFDYEYLATRVTGAVRAHCLGPGSQAGHDELPRPGRVLLLVLPDVDPAKRQGRIEPEAMTLSAELRADILSAFENRMVLGASLEVRAPRYHWVSIEAKLRTAESLDAASAAEVRDRSEAALYRYLNPYSGGPRGQGWPFGRDLHVSEVYRVLHDIPGIEGVEEIKLSSQSPGANPAHPISTRVAVAPDGVICSDHHRITLISRDEV